MSIHDAFAQIDDDASRRKTEALRNALDKVLCPPEEIFAGERLFVDHSVIKDARAELTALRARIRTLEGLLAKSEFAAEDEGRQYCWSCRKRLSPWSIGQPTHAPDCELKAALDAVTTGGADADN